MSRVRTFASLKIASFMFIFLVAVASEPAGAQTQTMDELHKAAIKEGGVVKFLRHPRANQCGKNSAGIREAISRHQGQSHRCHRGQACCQGDH